MQRFFLIVNLVLALSISSCAPIKSHEVRGRSTTIPLEAGSSVGQTFVARYGGLQGVELSLSPDVRGDGMMQLSLFSGPERERLLAKATLPLASIPTAGRYPISFALQPTSQHNYYYLQASIIGSGSVAVSVADEDTYSSGAAYRQDQPVVGQLVFSTLHNPSHLILSLVRELVAWMVYLLLAAYLFVLPGWGLIVIFFPRRSIASGESSLKQLYSWPNQLALSIGLSLAIHPLTFLFTDLVGLHLGWLYAGFPLLIWIGVVFATRDIWQSPANLFQRILKSKQLFSSPPVSYLPDLTLIIISGIVIAVRFWMIRNLNVPMWGDSYQHTMITQLILDNGGLFKSWQPYAPYESLSIHFGFSVYAALFSWISQLPAPQATLWTGQIINVLAVLSIFPLATKVSRGNHWAGAGALFVAGLLTPIPAYYVNWGRYAQLAGQTMLPASLWFAWSALESSAERGKHILTAGLILAGMTLTYFRMPFYFATFILALIVYLGIYHWRIDARKWLAAIAQISVIVSLAVLFFLPWAPRLLGGNLAGSLEAGVASASPLSSVLTELRSWQDIDQYIPTYILVLSLLSLILGLFKRCWVLSIFPLWFLALVGYMAGSLIKLPGANMLQSFALLIALYIPVGVLVGWLLGECMSWLANRSPQPALFTIFGVVLLVGLAGWAGLQQRRLLDPNNFALVTRPDEIAMQWIANNTPPQALFLVQGFSIYNGQSAVGADAGWWIPLLAHRQNTMPPQYALFNERPAQADYSQQIVDLVKLLETHSPVSMDGRQGLCSLGVTHIYNGQRSGKVGAGVRQLFDASQLRDYPELFTPIYQQDRVVIFELTERACAGLP